MEASRGCKSELVDFVRSTGDGDHTQHIYRCPRCVIVTGQPDTVGKCYFNPARRIGYCFRCKSVYIDERTIPLEDAFDFYQRARTDDLAANLQLLNKQQYDIDSWSQPALLNTTVANYLLEQRKLTVEQIQKFRLRACDYPTNAAVFPDYYSGAIRMYQIRLIDPAYWMSATMKYVSPGEAIRPVYGTWTINDTRRAIVCEGTLSAISTGYRNDHGSLATYGKSVTKLQHEILSNLPVDHFYWCLDGGAVRENLDAIQHTLRYRPHCYWILLPHNADPNDLSPKQFDRILDTRVLCVDRLSLSRLSSMVPKNMPQKTPKAWYDAFCKLALR